MRILPAIDLMNGCCVRLKQGRAEDCTIYSRDPVAQAQAFREAGAADLHVVDLDGAFAGEPRHTQVIAEIVRQSGLALEVGGGIRTQAALEALLEAGVARAIIGTRALEDTAELARWVKAYGGEHVAVGLDARGGFVQTKGWVETSTVRATELAKRVAANARAVMLCPYVYIAQSPEVRARVRCYPIKGMEYERHLYLCYRKELYFARFMEDFLAIVRSKL